MRPRDAFIRLTISNLASRLSFFLWSQVPDKTLLDLAFRRRLSDPVILEQQVKRMLTDPRSKSLVTNFAFQWLKIRDLDKIEPDAVLFANFDQSLGRHCAAKWKCLSKTSFARIGT